MDRTGLELEGTELECPGLELDGTELGWTGIDWTRQDRTCRGQKWDRLNCRTKLNGQNITWQAEPYLYCSWVLSYELHHLKPEIAG
jgi:hypothetical protein